MAGAREGADPTAETEGTDSVQEPVPAHNWVVDTLLDRCSYAIDGERWVHAVGFLALFCAGGYAVGCLVGVTMQWFGFFDLLAALEFRYGIEFGVLLNGVALGMRPDLDHD